MLLEQIKVEPVDEFFPMEVTAQNSQSNDIQNQYEACSDEIWASNLNGVNEK